MANPLRPAPLPASWTHQSLFDYTYAAVMAQGVPSVEVHIALDGWQFIACRYRDDAGHKCAIGHVIADEDYRPGLEDMALATVISLPRPSLVALYRSFGETGFLGELQRAHDQAAGQGLSRGAYTENRERFRREFHQRMARIAEQYYLNPLPQEPAQEPAHD